jgi:periplasmic protein TonB
VEPSQDEAAASLAQYRLQIISMARRYKRYPRVALDNNWEGATEVEMRIGPDGMISALTVRSSSGHPVLDEQAVQMFRRAKPLVPIPAPLRGKEFSLGLKAIYSLQDPDT